jgi:arginine/ornithine N-succinyltransferase beta subunit
LIFLQEDSKSSSETLDAEQVVSDYQYGFSVEPQKTDRLAGISILSCKAGKGKPFALAFSISLLVYWY